MKYIFLGLLLTGLISCKQPEIGENGVEYKDAGKYNDYIVHRQTRLMNMVTEFGEKDQYDIDSAKALLTGYVKETEIMMTEISGMPAWRKDSSLRVAAVNSFRFYKRLFAEDYINFLGIRSKASEGSLEDIAREKELIEKISKEEEKLDKEFRKVQLNFARKFNMKFREP